jgi:hypothetical protein
MGGRQIVLVSTAGFSVLNTGIFRREAKTKRVFSQCRLELKSLLGGGDGWALDYCKSAKIFYSTTTVERMAFCICINILRGKGMNNTRLRN